MTEKTEFRITVEGPPNASEQFKHWMRKAQSEAGQSGVSVEIEEITTSEIPAEYQHGSEL